MVCNFVEFPQSWIVSIKKVGLEPTLFLWSNIYFLIRKAADMKQTKNNKKTNLQYQHCLILKQPTNFEANVQTIILKSH